MPLILLSLFIVLCCTFPAVAAEKAVTLYPDSAAVREVADFVLKDNSFEIVLPEDLRDDTLRVTVDGARVIELSLVPVLQAEPSRVAALRARLDAAQKEEAELNSRLRDVHSRLVLWQKPSTERLDATAMLAMEHAMAERVPVLDAEIRALTDKLAPVSKTVAWLKQELARMVPSENNAPRIQAGGVAEIPAKLARIRLASATPNAALPATCTATVTYQLDNCGWTPRTVLEALPEQQQVRVRREATITQRTGQDWDNVTLSLSTVQPSASFVSDNPSQWRISPILHEARPAMARSAAPAVLMAPQQEMDGGPQASAINFHAPKHIQEATGTVWALGSKTLLSGDPLLISLDDQTWKAEFTRLLRPAERKAAWLRAAVTAPTPQQLDESPAAVYVNGQFMGTMPFAFSGLTGNLTFGDDPAVTALMEQDSNRSGESGLISKSQTRTWAWTIKVKNGHSFPVAVQIEDAAPQAGDERIKITTDSAPKPVLDARTLRWALDLKPGEENAIRHSVKFTAPDDMRISAGR